MGIATLPATSASSPLPYGATALVASGTASLGFYQNTSLPAGTYAVVLNPYAPSLGLIGSYYTGNNVSTLVMASSQVNGQTTTNNVSYISLATNDTLTVGQAGWNLQQNNFSSYAGSAVAYAASTTGAFITNSTNNSISYSTNGITWADYTSIPSNTYGKWYAAYAGNNIYLMGQNTTGSNVPLIAYSTNLLTWSTFSSNLSSNAQSISGITFNGSTYVAVSNSTTTSSITTSTNGQVWTTRYVASTALSFGVVWGSSGGFVSAGTNIIVQSTDGITWATRTPAVSNANLGSIAYNNSNGYYFIGGVTTNAMMYSSNGTTWTQSVSGKAVGYNNSNIGATAIATGGGYFWGYDQSSSYFCISTNGNIWSPVATRGTTITNAYNVQTSPLGYHPTQGFQATYAYSSQGQIASLPSLYVNIYSVAGSVLN